MSLDSPASYFSLFLIMHTIVYLVAKKSSWVPGGPLVGHFGFALFVFCNELSSTSPSQTMLVSGRGTSDNGEVHVHTNFKCPIYIDEPTLF